MDNFSNPEAAGTAQPDEDQLPADDLLAKVVAKVVAQLPIGLSISDRRDGRQVYSNAAASAHAVDQLVPTDTAESVGRRAIDRVRHVVDVVGRSYDVTTSVDGTERRRIEDELFRRAFFDDLTGLPKRNLLERSVDDMCRSDAGPFALSFIDIDNFKYINDYYGHAVGDQLLVKIARRISDEMRATDLLARVGGDEFVLLTAPARDARLLSAHIERIAARLKESFFIDGFEVCTSASIGVSLFPDHGASYEVLHAGADTAMYRMKAANKGGVCIFDETLSHAATTRMALEQRLRLAIRDRRLCCAFQPKVDFRADEIVGVEVLLRWRDENGEIKPPGEFIGLAIELGLMDDITMLVLEEVTEQIDLINEAFGHDVSISINVAARQGGDLDFMKRLAAKLLESGFPERFTLELTEEAFLAKPEFQTHVLPMLREIGTSVSIDDFGVGYSSLSALAEITADELKVDRSFITDIHRRPRSQSILKVIESLGAALDMRIIVEGVETFEELAYLLAATRISCAQGFYFAKPLLLADLPRVVGCNPNGRTAAPTRGVADNRTAAATRA